MSSNSIFLYSTLTALVAIGGVQDFRKGEVSNWITIPLLILGLVGVIARAFFSNDRGIGWFVLLLIALLTLAAIDGWMGGADWKILVALFGLWPIAGMTAILGGAVWGIVSIIWTGKRNPRFPGVTVFAFAVALTYLAQLSIIIITKV